MIREVVSPKGITKRFDSIRSFVLRSSSAVSDFLFLISFPSLSLRRLPPLLHVPIFRIRSESPPSVLLLAPNIFSFPSWVKVLCSASWLPQFTLDRVVRFFTLHANCFIAGTSMA